MSHGAYGSLLYDDLQHPGSEDVLCSGVGRDPFGGALNVHAFECRCVVDDADALAVIAFQSGRRVLRARTFWLSTREGTIWQRAASWICLVALPNVDRCLQLVGTAKIGTSKDWRTRLRPCNGCKRRKMRGRWRCLRRG